MKQSIFVAVVVYMMLSILLWGFRLMIIEGDCQARYIDYVFPITKLHCPVGK